MFKWNRSLLINKTVSRWSSGDISFFYKQSLRYDGNEWLMQFISDVVRMTWVFNPLAADFLFGTLHEALR